MKTLLPASLAATAMLLASLPADATPRNGRGNGNGAWTRDGFCPPGLSKRDPACVPPGQARRGDLHAVQGLAGAEPEDLLREVIRHADSDDEDRDKAQALAIIGTLMGLALLEQNAREREAGAAPPPVEPEPAPSYFSFSEVPSRPASIEALAAAQQTFGEAAPQTFGDAADPDFALAAPALPLPAEERTAPAASPPPGRIVPLGEPLPGPVPTPQEEALLSEVFRRAADEGSTGY